MLTDTMPAWKKVLRDGLVPQLDTSILIQLRDALRADDPRLIQGATTSPPPLQAVQDFSVECGCLVAFCGMLLGLETVGETEEFFARSCFRIDELVGEPAGCRHLLNAYDETPRHEAFTQIADALDEVIAEREMTA